jgi:hypothetical protein
MTGILRVGGCSAAAYAFRIHNEVTSSALDVHDSNPGMPLLMVLGLETLPEVFKLLKVRFRGFPSGVVFQS